MSKEQKAVIEKIKKLMRLSDTNRGATPAEAASAAAKAQALLLEHNLSMGSIGDMEEHIAGEKIGHETVNLEATYLTSRWHSRLMYRIAKPLFCDMVYEAAKAGKAGKAIIVGKPSNVEVVKYFYAYLHTTIDAMALEYRDEWREKMDKDGKKYTPDESFRVRVDFCLGAVDVVGERLKKEYEKATTTTTATTALTTINNGALKAATKALFPKLRNLKSQRQVNDIARSAGAVAGAIISLNKGVGSRSRKQVA